MKKYTFYTSFVIKTLTGSGNKSQFLLKRPVENKNPVAYVCNLKFKKKDAPCSLLTWVSVFRAEFKIFFCYVI